LHLYGDAYLEIVRDKLGNPVALYNIYAPSIKIKVDEHGTVEGYIQSPMGVLSGNKNSVEFEPNEVAHFRLPNPGNEVYGLSPLESLEIVIETDLYAQDYNRNFFKNHAVPRLHVDLGNCTLPQLKRIREYFALEIQGSANAHKTIVTEGGAKITPIGTKPNDMEFLNQRKFSRDEILSVLGVPPMKLGVFEDVNRACVPADTLVSTVKGYKKIIDIKPGDKVYSFCDNTLVEREVKRIFNNGKQKVYEVRLNDRRIEATDNHPFLVVRPILEKYSHGPTKQYRYTLEWRLLRDLKKEDFVVCVDKTQRHVNRRVFKNNIELTNEFMELVGLYLGDGSISKNNNGKLASIAFAIEDNAEHRKYYESLVEKVFKRKPTLNKHTIRFGSVEWGKYFEDLDLAHDCYTKVIPEWVWGLNDELKKSLFIGLIESDGTVNKRGTITYCSCNEHLVKQIKLLAGEIGIPSSNVSKWNRINDPWSKKPLYRVTFSNYDVNKEFIFRTSLYNERIQNSPKFRNLYKGITYEDAEKLLGDKFKVRRVTSNKFIREDFTYDIEIEGTHNYIAEGIVVHNSSQEADKSFKSEKIIPLQRMLAKKFNSDIISTFNKIGEKVLFEFVEVDLRDAKEQAQIDQIEIESGVLSIDEVRRKRGLGPKNKK